MQFSVRSAFWPASASIFPKRSFAIVAGADWDKPKLVEHLIEPLEVRPIVFTNLITACTWLDLDVVDIGREIQQIRLKLRHSSASQ